MNKPEVGLLETETIDKLFLELSQFTRARTKTEMLYDELLSHVGNKFPGESRHETALRYIRRGDVTSEMSKEKEVIPQSRPSGDFGKRS